MVTEQIRAITEAAEHQAEAIRSEAEEDAEVATKEAQDAAWKILRQIDRLEGAVQHLIISLRREADLISALIEPSEAGRSRAPGSRRRRGAPALPFGVPGEPSRTGQSPDRDPELSEEQRAEDEEEEIEALAEPLADETEGGTPVLPLPADAEPVVEPGRAPLDEAELAAAPPEPPPPTELAPGPPEILDEPEPAPEPLAEEQELEAAPPEPEPLTDEEELAAAEAPPPPLGLPADAELDAGRPEPEILDEPQPMPPERFAEEQERGSAPPEPRAEEEEFAAAADPEPPLHPHEPATEQSQGGPSVAGTKAGLLRGRIGGRRREASAATPQCVVCRRVFEGTVEEAEAEGWQALADQAVCETCQRAGWRIPAESGPVRRGRRA